MKDELDLQSQLDKKLGRFFSQLQEHHKAELDQFDKLIAQARLSLLDSHTAQLGEFAAMKRQVGLLFDFASRSGNNELRSDDSKGLSGS